MAPAPTAEDLSVSLASVNGAKSSKSNERVVRVSYGSVAAALDISFRRTIRVPDNNKSYDLPPDCGAFPLYSVDQFKDKLPTAMVAKGGLFLPIYGLYRSSIEISVLALEIILNPILPPDMS